MDASDHAGTLAGAFVALVSTTINLAVVFGVNLSERQTAAIVAEATAITTIAPLIGALIDHSKRQAVARVVAASEIGRAK